MYEHFQWLNNPVCYCPQEATKCNTIQPKTISGDNPVTQFHDQLSFHAIHKRQTIHLKIKEVEET